MTKKNPALARYGKSNAKAKLTAANKAFCKRHRALGAMKLAAKFGVDKSTICRAWKTAQ